MSVVANNNLAGRVNPEQFFRSCFPDLFKKLSNEQVADFCELAQIYAQERDPESIEAMVEILVPESLGEVVFDADVDADGAVRLDKYQQSIGDHIRRFRMEKKWSQSELAKRANLNQSHICRLEKGVHTPSAITVQRIAEALQINPSMLDPGMA